MPRTQHEMSPWRGWGPLLALPVAVAIFTPPLWPRWLFMWLLSFAMLAGCKWLVWRRALIPKTPWWRHLAFWFAWPGLNPQEFLGAERLPPTRRPLPAEWGFATLNALMGATLFWGAARLVPAAQEMLRGWIGMAGLVLMLHFGSLHLLSCFWRARGVNASPLMNSPLASTRVSEFWGKRWNTAFRDLTHRFLFRPLTNRLGIAWATLIGFLFSGLVHELVISLPAGAGYGGPTLFFLIQSIALLIERAPFGRAMGLGRGWRGQLFTLLVVALPARALFHPPFIREIILPFMKACGAL